MGIEELLLGNYHYPYNYNILVPELFDNADLGPLHTIHLFNEFLGFQVLGSFFYSLSWLYDIFCDQGLP